MGQSKVLVNHKFLYIASETDDNDVEATAHAKKEYNTYLCHSSTEKANEVLNSKRLLTNVTF